MATFARLVVPSFDLTWLQHEEAAYVLIPGGGGSTKSGVKNQIQIAREKGGQLIFEESFKTDTGDKSRLCSGIHCGVLQDSKIVCALLDSTCMVLAVDKSKKDSINLIHKCEFIADKAEIESSVNCCCTTRDNKIFTGGEDHTCRLWKVSKGKDKNDWTAAPDGDFVGHKAPVMALSLHPVAPWICSASKDGTCKIWDLDNKKLLLDIPFVDGLSGVGSATSNTKVTIECRGCCFSPDGKYLYTIQSARRGATHLLKWELVQAVRTGTLVVNPKGCVVASKVPSTRLKISENGDMLVLGASDGSVTAFDAESLRKVTSVVCHDLPVTGLGFAPTKCAAGIGKRAVVVSCSADNKMASICISDSLTSLTMALLFIAILLFVVSILVLLKHIKRI